MKTYLVGGAVRDKLLGYPFSERDWVVVGATPELLESQGFTPVGKDFPVFLHPQTREEYALARTERKTGHGYSGFTFYCDTHVTLEEDLRRRDLTINAIAEDEHGNIIDPYHGQKDIENKLLRHVSPAFAEDPVRILRIARFAARYHHLGFTPADETMSLMKHMVANGEVKHLVAERIWKETERALGEAEPAAFIQTLKSADALADIFPELDQLFGVPQSATHHPEIDTGVHALMSLTQASKMSSDTTVRFATLLHDLGKGVTPKSEWPRHSGHEERSKELIHALCERIAAPKNYRDLAIIVAEFHTQCHKAFELTTSALLRVLHATDAFRRPERFEQFLICCEADSRGRTGFENADYPQANYFRQALSLCQQVDLKAIAAQGLKGQAFGDELHQQRLIQLDALKGKNI